MVVEREKKVKDYGIELRNDSTGIQGGNQNQIGGQKFCKKKIFDDLTVALSKPQYFQHTELRSRVNFTRELGHMWAVQQRSACWKGARYGYSLHCYGSE